YGIIQMVIDGFCFVIYMLPYLIFCPGQTGGTFCLDAKSTQKNQDRKIALTCRGLFAGGHLSLAHRRTCIFCRAIASWIF
ncbi:MAG: hypothetical protein ACNS62_20180, partial [Candidatus Cyclobacteriaceae bacterium M3_2C_046]